MKHDLEETVIEAFMCKQPIIIVEGQDDIKFYGNIAELNDIEVNVQAIETIDGYSEGCEQVCNAMDELTDLFQNDQRLKKYVIGIIDRDVREYLNDVPVKENLLVLKYYSYETHLITDKTIKGLVAQLTKAPSPLITQDVVDMFKHDFEAFSKELYYFSLEALKKRCDNSYPAAIEYGESGGTVIGKSKDYRWGLINSKVDTLDDFASVHNISRNDLKYIAKGKWLVATWCFFVKERVRTLHELCGVQLPKCIYCDTGDNDRCLWRPSVNFQVVQIENLLATKQFIDLDEVKYISDYMKANLAC